MAIDAPTMLLLSMAIALIAAVFLGHEWRATRDAALACWSAGFAAVAVGCMITPLRQSASPFVGVWVANGLLIVAHLMFLRGMARFTGRKTSARPWAALLPWAAMLFVPVDAVHSGIFGLVTSMLVGLLALWTAALARPASSADAPVRRLGQVFLIHGLFYGLKASLVYAPGAFVDMLVLKGLLIQVSLLEGIVVEVLLVLLMAAAVRRRLEDRVAALANCDPLTGVLNRRAFEAKAGAVLARSARRCTGALLLIDVDHFKAINDTLGHGAGDRLLIALARGLTARMPEGALVARLGGDEFVVMAPDFDALELPVAEQALRRDFAAAGAECLLHGIAATLSIGAALPSGTDDLGTLMGRADAALYDAKRAGRDRLSVRLAPPRDGPGKERAA